MEKKVLIVEDNAGIFKMLEKKLDSNTYQVERARAVDEAKAKVKDKGPFDCYVVDLQVLAIGLTEEEMDEYQDREGFAFLKEYVWKGKTKEVEQKLKSQTIICSKYILSFKREYRDEIEGLYLVDKDRGFEEEVASLIFKITCKN